MILCWKKESSRGWLVLGPVSSINLFEGLGSHAKLRSLYSLIPSLRDLSASRLRVWVAACVLKWWCVDLGSEFDQTCTSLTLPLNLLSFVKFTLSPTYRGAILYTLCLFLFVSIGYKCMVLFEHDSIYRWSCFLLSCVAKKKKRSVFGKDKWCTDWHKM